MDELINAFKAQMYDKARSPFLAAFSFSWATWNLKTIIIAFSSSAITLKLQLINQLYPGWIFYLMQWVVYPLMSASVFILVYPLIAMGAFWYWNLLNNKIKKIQLQQDGEVPASPEEARKLRKLISDVSIEKQKVIDDLVEKNAELMGRGESSNNTIATLESEKRDLTTQIEAKTAKISELEAKNAELTKQGVKPKTIASFTRVKQVEPRDVEKATIVNDGYNSFLKEIKVSEVKTLYKLFPKADVDKILKSAFSFFNQRKLTNEEFKVLILILLAPSRRAHINDMQIAFDYDEFKLKAIIKVLTTKSLLYAIDSQWYGLTDTFQTEIYSAGMLSIENYQNILRAIFLDSSESNK